MLISFTQESQGEEISNFWPKPWTIPFQKNLNFEAFLIPIIFSLEELSFHEECGRTRFLINLAEKSQGVLFQNFVWNHRLSPLEKFSKFSNFLISMFL